jgi:hypothetical protein
MRGRSAGAPRALRASREDRRDDGIAFDGRVQIDDRSPTRAAIASPIARSPSARKRSPP